MVTVIGGANIDIAAAHNAHSAQAESQRGIITTSAGGVGRNIAENLARLGRPVKLITALGDDEFAQIITNSITLPNLDKSAILITPGAASDCYLNLVDSKGELLHAINQMEEIDKITPAYLAALEDDLRNSALIIVDCNLPQDTLAWLITLAGRPPLYIDGVSPEKIVKLKDHLGQFDGLKCNAPEARALLDLPKDATPEDIMSAFSAYDRAKIILTLGAEGAMLATAHQQIKSPLPHSDRDIISVSGAGDALFAGYIYAILNADDEETALQFGMDAAALTVQTKTAVHPDIALMTAKK